jgi:hypothetical protein
MNCLSHPIQTLASYQVIKATQGLSSEWLWDGMSQVSSFLLNLMIPVYFLIARRLAPIQIASGVDIWSPTSYHQISRTVQLSSVMNVVFWLLENRQYINPILEAAVTQSSQCKSIAQDISGIFRLVDKSVMDRRLPIHWVSVNTSENVANRISALRSIPKTYKWRYATPYLVRYDNCYPSAAIYGLGDRFWLRDVLLVVCWWLKRVRVCYMACFREFSWLNVDHRCIDCYEKDFISPNSIDWSFAIRSNRLRQRSFLSSRLFAKLMKLGHHSEWEAISLDM